MDVNNIIADAYDGNGYDISTNNLGNVMEYNGLELDILGI